MKLIKGAKDSKMKYLIVILIILSVTCTAAEKKASYPQKIGDFEFRGEKRYGEATAGKSAEYQSADTRIDIFCYNSGINNIGDGVGESVKLEMVTVKDAIKEYEKRGVYRNVKFEEDREVEIAGMKFIMNKCFFELADKPGVDYHGRCASLSFITGKNGNFLKIRATLFRESSEKFEKSLTPLVEEALKINWDDDNSDSDKMTAEQYFEACRKLAENGDTKVQCYLADCYSNGIGVEKDVSKAIEWYTKCAEKGNDLAQLELGIIYSSGIKVPKDEKKGVHWLTKAAELGNPDAQFYLASFYFGGIGVGKDDKKGFEWLMESAKNGNAKAQYHLSACYAKGKGGEKDECKATEWLKKSAVQGYSEAQRQLGLDFLYGKTLAKDVKKGVELLTKSAEQGNVEAQYALVICYYPGNAVIEDFVEAYKWSLIANVNGKDVKDMQSTLGEKMTKEQIGEAQKKAKEFLEKLNSVKTS